MGLTSRAGVMPLNTLADIAGPMARTLTDATRVFQVIVGRDPADPVTSAADEHLPQNYLAALVPDGLRGARIGVLRQAYERDTTDAEIVSVFMRAVGISGAPARSSSIPPPSRTSRRFDGLRTWRHAWDSSTTSMPISHPTVIACP